MITTDSAADVLARRKARFRAEARKPPPPLPTNRLTVWSGKVTRSDRDAAPRPSSRARRGSVSH